MNHSIKTTMLFLVAIFGLLLLSTAFLVGWFFSKNGSNADVADLEPNHLSDLERNKIAATLYSSPTCGCCHNYAAYLEELNFTVNFIETETPEEIKDENNIPGDLRSCHTVIIGNYSVEGHVPIEAINKLLEETPDIDGIALPGMPSGSPGMSGDKVSTFEIIAFKEGESVGIFQLV
ncbi:MAG: DUF411 domain-containing protein [Candidatus Heimdallarchaeota archaeon]